MVLAVKANFLVCLKRSLEEVGEMVVLKNEELRNILHMKVLYSFLYSRAERPLYTNFQASSS